MEGNMRTLALAAAFLLGGAGCATVGTLQTAHPIDRGSLQVAIEPGVWAIQHRTVFPHANLAVRYGFGNRWDLGARFGSGGFGLTSKFSLSDSYDEGLSIAVAPSVGGFKAGALSVGASSVHLQVPLLVGLGFGNGNELILGPKVLDWMLFTGLPGLGLHSNVLAVGGSVGLSLRVARGVRILPEIAMVRPILGSAHARVLFVDIGVGSGRPLYQASVGVLLGGEK
jgi:hypothetical protein